MAKYCPECGTKTVKKLDGGLDRDACPACGWVQYAHTAVGVGAMVWREGRVLLVERAIPPVGLWTLPSGWIEQDDTLETAVLRELKEETGLEGHIQGLICIRNIPKETRNETYVCFLCEVAPEGEPVADGAESSQVAFVHPTELDGLKISPFTRYLVEHYQQLLTCPWPLHLELEALGYPPGTTLFAPF